MQAKEFLCRNRPASFYGIQEETLDSPTHCCAIHNCSTLRVYVVSIEMMVSPSKILTFE